LVILGSDADLFNSPADWISPVANLVGDGRKVVIADNDHINALKGILLGCGKVFFQA
jgi:hypothetical protein